MKNPKEDIKIIEGVDGHWISLGENYDYSPTEILAYLSKSADIQILSKRSWFLTDDYEAQFKYKDYDFILCTPMDSIDIHAINIGTPNEIIKEMHDILSLYTPVSYIDLRKIALRLLFLPFNHTNLKSVTNGKVSNDKSL